MKAPAINYTQIDPLTRLVFEPVGNKVLLSVKVAGATVFQKSVPYNVASNLASNARRCAEQAAENELLL